MFKKSVKKVTLSVSIDKSLHGCVLMSGLSCKHTLPMYIDRLIFFMTWYLVVWFYITICLISMDCFLSGKAGNVSMYTSFTTYVFG